MLHYGELDTRINEGWPAYEQALKAGGKTYEAYIYPGANHGFHNDSTPRYDEAAAKLAWERTLGWFQKVSGVSRSQAGTTGPLQQSPALPVEGDLCGRP